jgi:dimethylaniline monooxygenase (N-oxide forming)
MSRTVAVIGAGPAGIIVARYLQSEGFETTIFDRGDRLGGQWSGLPGISGVWPSMCTNTSRVLSAFSDMPYPAGTPVYPANQQVLEYLRQFASRFGLLDRLRPARLIRYVGLAPSARDWIVRHADRSGLEVEERYRHVVVATGRYQKPQMPEIPGLASFTGAGGVSHTFDYRDPGRYHGLRVLVAGCAISALEIASDLATAGAARVSTTNRRQRYVLPKLLAGVPTDHLAFTRFGALAAESYPPEVTRAALHRFILAAGGSPDQFGASRPVGDAVEAGITLSQHYLPLVAEGRITPRPWIAAIRDNVVRFVDGREEPYDAIISGTGYALHLPFLAGSVSEALGLPQGRLDLHAFTFHPDLPGFAVAGLYHQVGPYFPVLELQARWIAYVWSGARPTPSRAEMTASVAASRDGRGVPEPTRMNLSAVLFARAAGVEPDLRAWPDLLRPLLFGPLSPVSFRLSGRDALPDAPQRVVEDAQAFGAVPTLELSGQQRADLEALARARPEYEGLPGRARLQGSNVADIA